MSPGGPPADYVDVAERIREFKAQYPDGSLQTAAEPKMFAAGDKAFIAYSAYAYRTPDDPRPGQGWAWEPVPGPTPFTKDSELMNAETSAWGRAIVALGFQTKHVASAEEVRNREQFTGPTDEQMRERAEVIGKPEHAPQLPASEKPVTPGVLAELSTMLKLLTGAFPEHPGQGRTWADVAKEHAGKGATELTLAEANSLLRWLEDQYNEATKANEVPFG